MDPSPQLPRRTMSPPNRRRQSHTFRLAVSTLGCWLAFFAIGCTTSDAGGRTPRVAELGKEPPSFEGAPDWVTRGCRSFWADLEQRNQVLCGIGSAPPSRNRLRAEETATARARASLSRSLRVTIESLVRLREHEDGDADLEYIAHQLSSTSMRGLEIEDRWRAPSGETHVLVSLELGRVQQSLREEQALTPEAREDLAQRAANAFAAFDARSRPASTPEAGTFGQPSD